MRAIEIYQAEAPNHNPVALTMADIQQIQIRGQVYSVPSPVADFVSELAADNMVLRSNINNRDWIQEP